MDRLIVSAVMVVIIISLYTGYKAWSIWVHGEDYMFNAVEELRGIKEALQSGKK